MTRTKLFHFRVTLLDVENPTVWREIQVPANYTFEEFHKVLQIAFGWSDRHLYEFNDKKDYFDKATFRIAVPSEYDAEYEEKTYNSYRKKLQSVFPKIKQLTYVYDFGDSWCFEILFLGSSSSDNCQLAHCSDGEGATPPEDCGGVGGYEAMKQSFECQNEEAASYREWLGLKPGENWDANLFSTQILRYINIALVYILRANYNL